MGNLSAWIDKKIDKEKFKNKNVFITGGNSGIGFELAKYCAYLGANIFLLCRSIEKAEKAKTQILEKYPDRKIEIIKLDLADFSSISECINEVKKYDVDMFVNNAGVYHLPKSHTKQGHEIIMGTNYIGNLYLANNLLPYLASLNHKVNYLLESSITSKLAHINFNDFFMEKKYNQMKIYVRSKLAVNCLYFDLCEKLKNNPNVFLPLAHPGVAYTPLIKKGYKNKVFEKIAHVFMSIVFHKPEKAALSLLLALNSNNKTCEIGPRGLFGVSGYPHNWRIKEYKHRAKVIEIGQEITN